MSDEEDEAHLLVDHDGDFFRIYRIPSTFNSTGQGTFPEDVPALFFLGRAESVTEVTLFITRSSLPISWTERARLAHAHEMMMDSPLRELFVTAWTGGLEEPLFQVFPTEAEAICKVSEVWLPDYKEDQDSIDIYRIDLTTLRMENLGLSPVQIATRASTLLGTGE